ncbi:lipocalin-like domain-containing protein [Vibrio alginolyticus]|uniref:lipocalin-like domain-containing protein n=1 Tax=Vibrio pelagius TaxID=28169 RepID=UPI002809BF93|nr:lipocalin-like domain-containing protein [Vibrio alginolyticus]
MDHNLIGTWHLVGFELKSEDGSDVLYPFGEKPSGQLIYTRDGFMSVALHSSDRAAFSSDDILSGTPAEFQMAMQTYSSYSGRIAVPEKGKLVHIIEHSLFPNWVGHSEERYYHIANETLTLTTDLFFIAGSERVGVVTFQKAL